MSRPLKWPHVYPRRNAGGTTTHVVDGGLVTLADGVKKRQRYYFKTKKAADEKAHQMRVEREKHGAVVIEQLSAASSELQECLALINASELGSLKEAVKLAVLAKAGTLLPSSVPNEAIVSLPASSSTVSLPTKPPKLTGEVITEYIDARIESKKGQRDTTHEEITRSVLEKALRPYLKQPINVITVAVVEKVLREGTKTVSTRGHWITAMNGLFKYASQPGRDYMSINPAGAVPRPVSYEVLGPGAQPDKDPVMILTAAQMTQLLRLAETEERFHCMIMALAVQAFLGLRRGETKRFPSFQLSNTMRHYDVLAKRTRSRANREVEVNPTFERWRKRYWEKGQILYPVKYGELLRQMVKRLKFAWTRSIIRHGFASHYYVVYGEEATVKQLGHRDPEMLYRHYRRKVSSDEGSLYWTIEPLKPAGGVSQTLADAMDAEGLPGSKQLMA